MLKIHILTIGTQGDVQPYIALGRGLQAVGHEVSLATLADFQSQVTRHGLKYAALRGDYLEAARPATDKGRPNPFKQIQRYSQMASLTLEDEWNSARDADVFIYNPAAFGGEDIAERLGVPAFAAFPAPLYSPTSAFPSPFFPFKNLGPFNKLSHRLFARLGTVLYKRPIAAWRREVLGLPPTRSKQRGEPVPMLYAYSPAVVPRPADWGESTRVTGYWFLDAPAGWQPSLELASFLESGPPPVYVGFGSMAMHDADRMTSLVLEALQQNGQRGILAKGWGGLKPGEAPESVFVLDSAPHDWLFERVSAVVHHGGAGTTGAGLRAGKPTVICPFVGDQGFWGRRVAALGVGPQPIPGNRLTAERLAAAIHTAVSDEGLRQRAAELGATIRAEDGIGAAVAYIDLSAV